MIGLLRDLGYEYDPSSVWAALALFAISLALVTWACLQGRWPRRGGAARLCPRCHYDVRGAGLRAAAGPGRCPECGGRIHPRKLLTRPRRTRRLVALALLALIAAHVTAKWPEVRRGGWIRLVPSTALVLMPMDVETWVETQFGSRPSWLAKMRPVAERELSARLVGARLWSWQEWILLKRIQWACGDRDDYGITPAQYDMAVALQTKPIDVPPDRTTGQLFDFLSEAAGVPFTVDWVSLTNDGLAAGDIPLLDAPETVAEALDGMLRHRRRHSSAAWDVTPQGVFICDVSRRPMITRLRIYDVSDMPDQFVVRPSPRPVGCFASPDDEDGFDDLIDLITQSIAPAQWVLNGGDAAAVFDVSGHLVVRATTRVHFEIEDMLADLRDALAAAPPAAPFEDGVTGQEPVARDRTAFGFLDRLRRRPAEDAGAEPKHVTTSGPAGSGSP